MRIEKILCTVLHEAHKQQVEETMRTLVEGVEGFYGWVTDAARTRHLRDHNPKPL